MSKFIKLFDNNEQRSTYELSDKYVSPYVSAIKDENGGGWREPHYNVPSNVLCVLTLKDKSNVYITGENTFNMNNTYPYHEDIVSAIITNRCTNIGENSFVECSHLSSVTISDSVTTIGIGAFMSCSLLSNIIIPQSVTSIGNSAFLECTSLSSVILSNNITNLEISTFQNCTSLEYISLPNKLKALDSYVFYYSGIKELIIPEGVTEINSFGISTCPNLELLTFPSSLETVSDEEFLSNCEQLRVIKINGTKDMTNILSFYDIRDNSNLTLYVDSSLVETYKRYRDSNNWRYKVLPLEN